MLEPRKEVCSEASLLLEAPKAALTLITILVLFPSVYSITRQYQSIVMVSK